MDAKVTKVTKARNPHHSHKKWTAVCQQDPGIHLKCGVPDILPKVCWTLTIPTLGRQAVDGA